METIPADTVQLPGQTHRLPRVFYGAIFLQVVTLGLLFIGRPWGLSVSLFLQGILCWSVVVILYVDVRMRMTADASAPLDCAEAPREPGTALCFYHHLLEHLEREKKKNDRGGGSTAIMQFHLHGAENEDDSPEESRLQSVVEKLRDTLPEEAIIGKAGAWDLLAVLPGTSYKEASNLAGRLRGTPGFRDDCEKDVQEADRGGASVAVAAYPRDGETVKEVLAAANRPFARDRADFKEQRNAAAAARAG